MNINCVICSDLFTRTGEGEVFTTQCGHVFHYACLMNWIERSKTCPQCRNRCTEKTIHKIYFNLANTDTTEDMGTLQNKLENMQFQITLKEKSIKQVKEKYKETKNANIGLKDKYTELNKKNEMLESAISALKSQLVYFKSKAKESDKLTEELVRLKHKIKDMENVHMAINGAREQVNEMLRNENNVESLALLAATLKKSLVDADRKKHDMEHSLNRAHNEATRCRRECSTLESENNELKKELHYLKSNHDREKQYLKNKIQELSKKTSVDNLDITNTSLRRITTESPVNYQKKVRLASPEKDVTESPSVEQKVQKIVESDSPYLPVKSSNVAIDYISFMNPRIQTKLPTKSGYSIFRPPTTKLENMKLPKNDVNYNGLGGSSKDEVFPSPKPIQTGLKRHKSSSSVSSSKFRKLAPSTKVTDFLNTSTSSSQ